jgi:carboxyl-terminal processing protease
MKNKRAIFYSILVLSGLIISFLAGYVVRGEFSIPNDELFPLLNQAYEILRDHGYQEIIDRRALEYGMVRGMLQAYADPYSIFLEPAQHELETNNLEGNYYGIGVDLQKNDVGIFYIHPLPGSPAKKAGLLNGDRLFKVDDLVIEKGTTIESVQAALSGNAGETVTLKVGRAPDYNPFRVEVVRDFYSLPSTTSELYPKEKRIGIVRVNIIADSSPDEILGAFNHLRDQGATHFILDLRNNSGGLLNAGIDIARLFLHDGAVIQQQYKGKSIETIYVEKPGELIEIPLIVLVNKNTASAAEIIAGALKKNQRAWLIGETTYGKDSIQLVFDLFDGSSLHITSAKWWIPGLDPGGGSKGIEPDLVVLEDSDNSDTTMEAARRYFFP